MKIQIKPVEDINKWYRFWSLRFAAIGIAIMGFLAAWPDAIFTIWSALPDEVRFVLPDRLIAFISLFIFIMSALSRLVRQNVNDKAKEKKPD